ncbi:TetR/AcrR family transcriptional regulator [Patulibacter americanus]|uniref:TetR/AcrR family transcriptional regulator n=1 Tax=Patulibacter americanus TaxID=588672 RepID=UPI0003B44249|nr:TetR/AcrR family transcriptional regulator [Patulibacter americanus]
MTRPRGTRRAQAAAETRRLVLAAALGEFRRSGYARATANDIAAAAGVSVATVYTSVGGKPDLLETLVREGVADTRVRETLEAVAQATSGAAVLRAAAHGTRTVTESQEDIVAVLLDSASAEPRIGALLVEVRAAYRGALDTCATRLVELDVLRDGVGAQEASAALWFLFGLGSWPRLTEDIGWSYDRAEEWLVSAAEAALLRP